MVEGEQQLKGEVVERVEVGMQSAAVGTVGSTADSTAGSIVGMPGTGQLAGWPRLVEVQQWLVAGEVLTLQVQEGAGGADHCYCLEALMVGSENDHYYQGKRSAAVADGVGVQMVVALPVHSHLNLKEEDLVVSGKEGDHQSVEEVGQHHLADCRSCVVWVAVVVAAGTGYAGWMLEEDH